MSHKPECTPEEKAATRAKIEAGMAEALRDFDEHDSAVTILSRRPKPADQQSDVPCPGCGKIHPDMANVTQLFNSDESDRINGLLSLLATVMEEVSPVEAIIIARIVGEEARQMAGDLFASALGGKLAPTEPPPAPTPATSADSSTAH